jgi:hypothetical protein
VELKHSDLRVIDEAFQADPGYCLNFSDRTFSEFFEDEFRIDINDSRYKVNGGSKMNRLRTFIRISNSSIVGRVIRSLVEHREATFGDYKKDTKDRIFALVQRIESGNQVASTDALERFVPDQTLDELIGSIERDIQADKPASALDRLHTYCSKKFGHLLDKHGVAWDRSEPLNSRVGKYVKFITQEKPMEEVTTQILKNSIGVFEKYNYVRNNKTLAHDNEVVSKYEARYIFDSISATLRFIKSIDASHFD